MTANNEMLPDNPVVDARIGNSPIIVSMPHSGLTLPKGMISRMTHVGLSLKDTDWHIPELYDFVYQLDATVIKANYSRYVVDLNRPANNESLYPGQATTGICPEHSFVNEPLYKTKEGLTDSEVNFRVEHYWKPYHQALGSAIERVKQKHGYCILYDAHSIRSEVPRLFSGTLPTLNVGTAEGQSCDSSMQTLIEESLNEQKKFSTVTNGRFVGGYITRNYGVPKNNVHAIQMEIAQHSYMLESNENTYLAEKAEVLKGILEVIFEKLLHWR